MEITIESFMNGFLLFVQNSWIGVLIVSITFVLFDIIELKRQQDKSITQHRFILLGLFIQYLVIVTVFGYLVAIIAQAFHLFTI